MKAWMEEVGSLDWEQSEWPEGFQPLDAIVMVKGIYETDDGSLSRPVWCHRWTVPLSRNVYERIGVLDTMLALAQDEAVSDYEREGDGE